MTAPQAQPVISLRQPVDQPFALVVDRHFDGSGLSLAIHDNVNYQFTDGDCFERDGDTLDGYTAEFLTQYALEQRLKSAATPAQPVAKVEELTRYCPGCGSVGAIDIRYHNCCPDGNDARMIPKRLANQCHDTFKLALKFIYATPQPVISPAGWQLVPVEPTQAMLDYADKTVPIVFSIGDEYRAMLEAAPAIAPAEPGPVQEELKVSGEMSRMTQLKANSILQDGSYQMTGYVLSNEDGKRAVVERGAVRWIEKDAMWDLMHGPDKQPVIAPVTKPLARPDAAEKDAARIDWLDREIACPLTLQSGRVLNLDDKGLRHVIDIAMKSKP